MGDQPNLDICHIFTIRGLNYFSGFSIVWMQSRTVAFLAMTDMRASKAVWLFFRSDAANRTCIDSSLFLNFSRKNLMNGNDDNDDSCSDNDHGDDDGCDCSGSCVGVVNDNDENHGAHENKVMISSNDEVNSHNHDVMMIMMMMNVIVVVMVMITTMIS